MQNKEVSYQRPVAGVLSITNKSENQDSCMVMQDEVMTAIVVADGLGGGDYGAHARVASSRVVDCMQDRLLLLNGVNHCEQMQDALSDIFLQAKKDLLDLAKQQAPATEGSDPPQFGTTAIVALETADHITIAYTGNGAAWHIRGNFTEFSTPYHFPWNAVNLLNPHSVPENGKEALYRLISNGPDTQEAVPSIVQIRKDLQEGDIVMICSDGIYSADQVPVGTNKRGVWQQCEPVMLAFFKMLKQYVENTVEHNSHTLNAFLDEFLQAVKPQLNDDATVGLLITQQALAFHANKKYSIDENNTGTQV